MRAKFLAPAIHWHPQEGSLRAAREGQGQGGLEVDSSRFTSGLGVEHPHKRGWAALLGSFVYGRERDLWHRVFKQANSMTVL